MARISLKFVRNFAGNMQLDVVLLLCVGAIRTAAARQDNNLWLVQLNENENNAEIADELAKRYGYRLYRSVSYKVCILKNSLNMLDD